MWWQVVLSWKNNLENLNHHLILARFFYSEIYKQVLHYEEHNITDEFCLAELRGDFCP